MAVLKQRPPEQMADVEKMLSAYPVMIDLSTARIKSVLAELGDPQERLPPVFHVAGTNGKGSTLAFLQAMLEAGGLRAHKFISPHLVRINERIVLAGKEIGDAYFYELLRRTGNPDRLSRFEAITVAAFLAFSKVPADAVLLETGLGGRRDATNVVSKPAVTIISRLSLDHQKHLGSTLAAIAREKAGIMRPGVSCVVGAQYSRETEEVLAEEAALIGAPLYRAGHEWRVEKKDDGSFVYEGGRLSGVYAAPGLLGDHQYDNAGLALAALEKAPMFSTSCDRAEKGLKNALWPARFQRLTKGPLPLLLPPGWGLWLDGAHNDSGAAALARQIKIWGSERPAFLILGLKRKKDPAVFARALAGLDIPVRTVNVPESGACHAAEDLARVLPRARAAGTLSAAISGIVAENQHPGRIVIAGSLYLAGHILQDNG